MRRNLSIRGNLFSPRNRKKSSDQPKTPDPGAAVAEALKTLNPQTPTPPKQRPPAGAAVADALIRGGAAPREAQNISVPWSRRSAFIVDGLLSDAECEALIALSEAQGYESALINIGGGRQMAAPDIRKSGRCIIDSEAAAQELWERIRHLLPREIVPGTSQRWRPVGLNERLRFLKYTAGDYFAPHRDGHFVRDSGPGQGETSYFTVMLYLNDAERGGATNFVQSRDESHVVSVQARRGRCLCFEHDMYHEGERLAQGVKYAIRTDVMFAKVRSEAAAAAPAEAAAGATGGGDDASEDFRYESEDSR